MPLVLLKARFSWFSQKTTATNQGWMLDPAFSSIREPSIRELIQCHSSEKVSGAVREIETVVIAGLLDPGSWGEWLMHMNSQAVQWMGNTSQVIRV